MIKTRTYELSLTKEQKNIIDIVSNTLRVAYNNLLGLAIADYNDNNNSLNLLHNRNIRDYLIRNKKGTDYENYYSSLVKNTALRLKSAYINFFKYNRGYPKFKAYNRDWFSLYYDEPGKMPTINGNKVLIKLGKDREGNNLNFECGIKKFIKNEQIKTARIIKKRDKYYIQFVVEIEDKQFIESTRSKDWVSIDPNHKNFFAAIDSDGKSIEVDRIDIGKQLDIEIDKVKSLISKTKKYSRRRIYLINVLDKLFRKRDEQITKVLYEMANYLAKRYNVIIIGDYTPSVDVAKHKNQRRSMLNQTYIGKFRTILKYVCAKYRKQFYVVDEKYTTMKCCITNTLTKRPPEIRDWVVNGRKVLRDINSAINIANKHLVVDKSFIADKANISSIDVSIKLAYNKKLTICLAQTIIDSNNDSVLSKLGLNDLAFYENP